MIKNYFKIVFRNLWKNKVFSIINIAGLAIGMGLTAMTLAEFRPPHWPAWWLGGLAFIGIELVTHLVLQLRGRPSFYNGRG